MPTLTIFLAVFWLFVFGLIIGSFLNVVIIRSASEEKLTGRSHCRSCKAKLTARELIPLVSFCVQKRRCRSCGAVFSSQYFWVEFICGLFFAGIFYILGGFNKPLAHFLGWLIFWCILASLSIVIFVSDLRFKIIPNGAVIFLLFLGIVALVSRDQFLGDLLSAFFIAAFFALLWLFSKGKWMGLGDAKLVLATSMLVGYPLSVVSFLFSFWLGGIIGLGVVFLSGRKQMKSLIPFGPFILAGTLAAYFFGNVFLSWSGLIYLL